MMPINQGMRHGDLVLLAQYAEEAGLDAVGIGEYASSDAFALAAAIAVTTNRIRIETAVVTAVSRSSALTAMASATLADLSGGRFVLGIGAGTPVVAGFHRRSFERPIELVSTMIDEVRTLLRGGVLADNRFRLRVSSPIKVPILLSAINPKMVRLAAEISDGVLFGLLCDVGMVTELAEMATDARRATGRTEPLEISAIFGASASVDAEPGRERARQEMAGYFLVPTYASSATRLVGKQGVASAAEAYARGGIEELTNWVPNDAVDAIFAAGGPDDLQSRIRALAAAGATSIRCNPMTLQKGDTSAAMRVIDELADARRLLAT
jgi:alkanesulfonate monooxygenase SsuD/methylene tetrahydromethanopterin reductase-like flavin-dependent oxidoreductase (luciferase family)